MFLIRQSFNRGITALTQQAYGRTLHTSHIAMAPIKVNRKYKFVLQLHNDCNNFICIFPVGR